MKSTLSTLPAALCGLFAGAACAQSSVTLYGVVDANLRWLKTGSTSAVKQEQDGILGSRFGLRGDEDLGGGLRAGFNLESAIKPDTGVAGTATALFTRRSTVSLMADSWGEIRLGRDGSPTWNNIITYDHFGTGIGSLTKLFVPPAVNASEIFGRRIDNTVNYFLPANLGGWYGQLQLAPGEGAASGKTNGWRLGYQGPAFNLGLARTAINVDGGQWRQVHVGGSYDFSGVKLVGQAITSRTSAGVRASEKVWELGAVIAVGPAGAFKLGYARASDYAQATKPTVGYVHDLSRRTALYTTYTRIRNTNANAAYAVESAPVATVGQRQTSTGFEVGIRHMF